jgi:peroxiredoxin Q/BCP
MLELGDAVPDLPLTLTQGGAARLSDYSDRWLVLFFYPKDSTPACTTEALEFDALLTRFRRQQAEVLGISRDTLASHRNYRARQGLRLDLVSDADEAVCQAFDVIRLKTLYGRKVLGIERSTFLISPQGRLAQAWRGVRVPGHAEAVLGALKQARSTK